jgi:hypothetical protein
LNSIYFSSFPFFSVAARAQPSTVDVNEETAQQTNINVGEQVQKVAMTKVLVDKSTQTDDLGGSYNLQFVLNHLL